MKDAFELRKFLLNALRDLVLWSIVAETDSFDECLKRHVSGQHGRFSPTKERNAVSTARFPGACRPESMSPQGQCHCLVVTIYDVNFLNHSWNSSFQKKTLTWHHGHNTVCTSNFAKRTNLNQGDIGYTHLAVSTHY